MDMRWFDDVLVLLEEKNMTRAAERRNITQPAFSRRIRSFEDWLGIDILVRKKNSIDINPALTQNEDEIRLFVAQLNELKLKIAHHDPAASICQSPRNTRLYFQPFQTWPCWQNLRFLGFNSVCAPAT